MTAPDTNPTGQRVSRRPPVPRRSAAPAPRKARMPSGFASIRDILSFVAGLLIVGNEVFLQDTVELAILTVGGALLGLPVVFGADERRKAAAGEEPAA